MRLVLSFSLGVLVAGMLGASPSQAGGRGAIQDALKARYRVSTVEIQD